MINGHLRYVQARTPCFYLGDPLSARPERGPNELVAIGWSGKAGEEERGSSVAIIWRDNFQLFKGIINLLQRKWGMLEKCIIRKDVCKISGREYFLRMGG